MSIKLEENKTKTEPLSDAALEKEANQHTLTDAQVKQELVVTDTAPLSMEQKFRRKR